MLELNKIYNQDCLIGIKDIADNSIDMVLSDLPYGITACKWDTPIDLNVMWKELKRVCKKNAAMVFTASQPFTSVLVMSNLKEFRYEWIWNKKIPSGMSYAKFQPMRQHESILVFSRQKCNYYPQKIIREKPITGGGMSKGETTNNQNLKALHKIYLDKNPITIIQFDKIRKNSVHPTQKPVELFKYLIKTYTLESDVVLDLTIGSGTTAVACLELNRQFIGFEMDEKYYKIACERITKLSKDLCCER